MNRTPSAQGGWQDREGVGPVRERGLLLALAAFTWPSVWPRRDPPWDPALVYPPAGTADLWTPDTHDDDALEALLGRGARGSCASWTGPASTLELVARIGVGAGSVSTTSAYFGARDWSRGGATSGR